MRSPALPAAVLAENASSELTGWASPAERIRMALECDELQLYVQPIASLAARERAFMGEVLVRMREEESKLLPPGEFLPVFEHFRMMPALDRWVVRHVLSDRAVWSEHGYSCLSVNISGQTLDDEEFLPFVAEELVRRDVSPDSLCFEIDEAATLRRIELVKRFAAVAQRIGCPILVDGFGARSVSFGALEALQPRFVKVDGVIVRRILDNPKALEKLAAIQRFCRVHRAKLIAECVESQPVLAKLVESGVGLVQGFGIALPHPIGRPVALPYNGVTTTTQRRGQVLNQRICPNARPDPNGDPNGA